MKPTSFVLAAALALLSGCTRTEPVTSAPELTSGPLDASFGHGVGSAGALGTNRVETPAGGFRGPGSGPHVACAPSDEPLSDATRRAIERALADERRIEARYDADVRSLGGAPPFRRLERAERRHAAALEALLAQHGAPVPSAEPPAALPDAKDRREACTAGVESEKRNVALYDELLTMPGLPPDVRCVFSELRGASRDRHLPSLTACAGGR